MNIYFRSVKIKNILKLRKQSGLGTLKFPLHSHSHGDIQHGNGPFGPTRPLPGHRSEAPTTLACRRFSYTVQDPTHPGRPRSPSTRHNCQCLTHIPLNLSTYLPQLLPASSLNRCTTTPRVRQSEAHPICPVISPPPPVKKGWPQNEASSSLSCHSAPNIGKCDELWQAS